MLLLIICCNVLEDSVSHKYCSAESHHVKIFCAVGVKKAQVMKIRRSFPWRNKCDSHSFITVWVKETSPTTIQMNTGVFSIASLEKS